MIPYSRQTIGADDIRAVVRVLKSDLITQGPVVGKFEAALAKRVGARFAVAFSSGTAALQAAYFAAGIKKGNEIITSPFTFAATANAALWQGAKVVFADIEDATGNIDPKDVEKKITKRTKAIVAVDYAGFPADYDALKKIARKHRILLFEDAAHALGASYRGKPIGSIADMTMFSFHPVKSITTGEGGAMVTNQKDFYERLKLFRNHGITRDEKKFKNEKTGDWYYEMQVLGQNYRLTDIQAALGLSQLKKMSKFIAARRRLAGSYHKKLSVIKNVILPLHNEKGIASAWHLYAIRLAESFAKKRAEIFSALRKAGIGVQVHYIPVYWHPYYRKLGYKRGLCPRAEAFSESVMALPLFPTLSAKDQEYVIRMVRKYVS